MLQSSSGRRGAEERDRSATPKAAGDSTSPSANSPSEESEGSGDAETYDDWLQHMRVIEFLRNGIRNRLERRDYEDDDTSRIDPMVLDSDRRNSSNDANRPVESRPSPPQPLYPVLPRIG